jgi:hypothetical protein
VALTIILATQGTAIRRLTDGSQPRQIVRETLSQKYLTGRGLVEWLKMKVEFKPQHRKQKNSV